MTETIAFQLSLFGDKPKPCRVWRRPLFLWHWAGMALPPTDDALRQMRMLTPDSHAFEKQPERAA